MDNDDEEEDSGGFNRGRSLRSRESLAYLSFAPDVRKYNATALIVVLIVVKFEGRNMNDSSSETAPLFKRPTDALGVVGRSVGVKSSQLDSDDECIPA